MNKHFIKAVAALTQANEAFQAGLISAMDHSSRREAALAAAMHAIAATFGVTFKNARYINSLGEFTLCATKPYGQGLSALLNTANPRCGVLPGAVLTPEASWCYMNHFDVERLVRRVHAQQKDKDNKRRALAQKLSAALSGSLAAA